MKIYRNEKCEKRRFCYLFRNDNNLAFFYNLENE